MRVPAALVAIPLLAGAAIGLQFFDIQQLAACAAGAAILACLAGVAFCADRADVECTIAVIAGALLAGVSLGADAARRAYEPRLLEWFASHRDDGPVVLEGTLREDAALASFGVSMLVDVFRIDAGGGGQGRPEPTGGGVRLVVSGALAPGRAVEWRAGRRVRVTALLREPTVYLNPGAPDVRRSLARRGIVLVGSVKSASLVTVTARGSRVAEAASACRIRVRRTLADVVGRWERRSAAIATAILIGDRTGLPDEDERRLQEAGTYHVIAISGGNIAILTLLLLWTTRLIGVGLRTSAAFVIVTLIFYGQLAGGAASVERAVLAAVAYLAGRLLDHKGGALNILASVAAGLVAAAPVTVVDPGFVLSFGATLGILLCVPAIQSAAPAIANRMFGAISAVLFATVAAEAALAPIGAWLFSRVTFAGLLLNFAAIPLMTAVQIGSMVAIAITSFDPNSAATVGYAVHVAATWLVESARLVDAARWLSVTVRPPDWWLLTTYYATASVTVLSARHRTRAAMAAGVAFLLIVTGAAASDEVAAPARGVLRVVFLDVGQADATLVRFPDGRSYLVDAAGLPAAVPVDHLDSPSGGFDAGDRVIAPALRALRIQKLDTFVLTHPDPDHIGGALAVLRAFRPRAVWEGVPVPPHAARRRLVEAADAARLEWRVVQRGEHLRAAGIDVRVLHPPRPEWERQRVRNEDSVVLEFRLGGVSIVLPGDIGREGEREVLRHMSPAPLVILKAPHHGSATSSTPELLAALSPRLVIFSAGRANRFGHPAPSVVARYNAIGTAIFSTAEDGAVILDTDGESVHVRGWTGREAMFRVGSNQR